MEAELNAFNAVIENPKRPLLAILGGAKIADKIPLINNLLEKANELIIGGGMAFTFKKVLEGMEIGDSLFDPEGAKIAKELFEKARPKGVTITLPVDFVCGDKFDANARTQIRTDKEGIPAGWMGLDAGPKSRALYDQVIAPRPDHRLERPLRRVRVRRLRRTAPSRWRTPSPRRPPRGATTVVGGGDTATAAKKFKVVDKVTHCSTGGGASLEFLEGKVLPGVAFLEKA